MVNVIFQTRSENGGQDKGLELRVGLTMEKE
jgi:hypothetical protein